MLPVLLALALLTTGDLRFATEHWASPSYDAGDPGTFDWAEPPALGEFSRRSEGRLTHDDRIRDAIRAELEARGLEKATGDAADVLVAFALLPPDGPRRPEPMRMLGRAVQGVTVELGSRDDDLLVLELLEPIEGTSVWRGRAGPIFRENVDLYDVVAAAARVLLGEEGPGTDPGDD